MEPTSRLGIPLVIVTDRALDDLDGDDAFIEKQFGLTVGGCGSRDGTAAIALVMAVYGGGPQNTPGWLQRPGRDECGHSWSLVCDVYTELAGMELPT